MDKKTKLQNELIKDEIRKSALIVNSDLAKMSRANFLPISSPNASVYTQSNAIDYVEKVSQLGNLYSKFSSSYLI